MRLFEKTQDSGSHDLAEVNQAAADLQGLACTLSARHVKDGISRLQFNREIACFVQGIVSDVKAGSKSVKEGLYAFVEEQKSLISQSEEAAKKYIGLTAGAAQVQSGFELCTVTRGALCIPLGIPTIAHGINNIYENGRNLIEERSDIDGPIRKLYQNYSIMTGGTASEGNINYGKADIGLSIYGLLRKVKKKEAWRLWRHIREDFTPAYRAASKGALFIEASGNAITLESINNEINNNND